ncbi:MAG TPA: IPT/TIG domain-containing protein [Solirubrobacteraceae bacterium]|jgi:alpha-tubulin suppressor-like RCC1 family protein|nr:IPT/TIG domain-containing protein [Solirubrobacteraceae bacterium]
MSRFIMAAACLAAIAAAGVGAVSAASGYSVAALGSNAEGQLGDGTVHASKTAVIVEAASGGPLSGVKAIAAGENHTLALLGSGEVLAWGQGHFGQLGDGTLTNKLKAVPVEGLPGSVKGIAAGSDYSLALLENGHVWSWGYDVAGELGNGEVTTTPVTKPVEVKGLSGVVAISAGEQTGYALRENGEVVAWGRDRYGELGNGINEGASRPEPGPVELPEKATAIAGGGYQGLALLESGKVAAWGFNGLGQLGDPEAPEDDGTPVIVGGVSHATAIATGYWFGMALLESEEVKTWGENKFGELGNGSFGPEECLYLSNFGCSRTAVEVKELKHATTIAAGYEDGYALLETGLLEPRQRLWGWGDEDALEATHNANTPVLITGLDHVHAVSGGKDFVVTLGPPLPTITHLSKTSGSSIGGDHVTITGTHLAGGTVRFGASEAKVLESAEASITAEAPAHAPQTVDVTVAVSAGTSPKVTADDYRYLPSSEIVTGRCVKVTAGTGAYKTGECTEPLSGGTWKWEAGSAKAGFTGKPIAETEIAIESEGGTKVACEGESTAGEYSGPAQVKNVTFKLTGCKLASSGEKCTSTGAATGEIASGTLEGTLGWVEPETNKVGLELTAPLEGLMATAECGTTKIALGGELIGQITQTNIMRKTFTVRYKQKKGVQTIQHFWNEINNATLELSVGEGKPEQAALTLEETLTNEEEVEINTVL